jgi:tetratricopeptide (TPR) repeat protein
LARGKPAEAARAFSRAVELKPTDTSYATREIKALLEANQLELAEARAVELLSRYPGEPSVVFARGRIEESRGRLRDALAYYRKAAQLAPHQAEYHYAHGKAAEAASLPDEAEDALRAALREGPGLLEAYGALASLLLGRGRAKEAIFLLASVVRWHPERPELAMLLAEAWSKQGYPDRAKALYQSLLDRKPEGLKAGEVKEALGRLDKAEGGARVNQ